MTEPTYDAKNGSWSNPKLQSTLTEGSSRSLLDVKTVDQLASVLEVPIGQLNYIAYSKLHLYYTAFNIPKKSGGYRTIHAPSSGLKIIQKKIKTLIEPHYRVKKPVFGFIPGNDKDIKANAKEHKKKKLLVSLDLKDFFGSIHFGRVAGIFMAPPFNMAPKVAHLLAQICCYQGHLPQGAPTSPILSNLAASHLDREMVKLAKKYNLKYTRYADDLSFSTNRALPSSLVTSLNLDDGKTAFSPSNLLVSTINNCGFKINLEKFRVRNSSQRQEVTGLTSNQFPNVSKPYMRETRALIHSFNLSPKNAETRFLMEKKNVPSNEIDPNNINGDILKAHIYGRLSFIKHIRGSNNSTYLKMCLKMAETDPNPPKFIAEIKRESQMYDVFICHASEDKDMFARPLFDELIKLNVTAFLDEEEISWGDSLVSAINVALAKSKYVIAILSPYSVTKAWPLKEINAVLSQEIDKTETKLLPLICGEPDEILTHLPLLRDKLYKTGGSSNMDQIAKDVYELLSKN